MRLREALPAVPIVLEKASNRLVVGIVELEAPTRTRERKEHRVGVLTHRGSPQLRTRQQVTAFHGSPDDFALGKREIPSGLAGALLTRPRYTMSWVDSAIRSTPGSTGPSASASDLPWGSQATF